MDSGFFLSAKLLAVPALFALVLTLLLAPLLLPIAAAASLLWVQGAELGRAGGGRWCGRCAWAASRSARHWACSR